MKENKRVRSLKSIEFRRLALSLAWVVGPHAGDSGSLCCCSSVWPDGQKSLGLPCPADAPWDCTRQGELFAAGRGRGEREQGSPPTCNTGVTRPECVQGKQKANSFFGPKGRAK